MFNLSILAPLESKFSKIKKLQNFDKILDFLIFLFFNNISTIFFQFVCFTMAPQYT